MTLHFHKLQGCGNDFLFLDFLHSEAPFLSPSDVQWACDRHFGLGADGLVVLRPSRIAQAGWAFYNRDGSEAAMCGNAARCAIRFLSEQHFPGNGVITLETGAGVVRGRKLEGDQVEVILPNPETTAAQSYQERLLKSDAQVFQVYCLDTGVPHAVLEVSDLVTYPVLEVGAEILSHPVFYPERTNVTFFQRLVGSRILSTTFERGVETETLACGTGAVAAARIFSELYQRPFPVEVQVPGGVLIVDKAPASSQFLLQGLAQEVWDVKVEEIPRDFRPQLPFNQRRSL